MKKSIYFLMIVMFIFYAYGCGMYFGYKQDLARMDLSDQINRPIDDVWQASLNAAEELGIIVDEKEFNGKKGIISGHVGDIDFIRILIEYLKPEVTLIGIQARTSPAPLLNNGYKIEFAQSIMEQVKENLGQN